MPAEHLHPRRRDIRQAERKKMRDRSLRRPVNDIDILNSFVQDTVNRGALATLQNRVDLNVARMPVPMSGMSLSWKVAFTLDHFRALGATEYAEKLALAFSGIPGLVDFENTMPHPDSHLRPFANAATMISHKLPGYLENAYAHSIICMYSPAGRRVQLPHQILDPELWPQYFPEMANLTPTEVCDRIELMLTRSFENGTSVMQDLRDQVKIVRDQDRIVKSQFLERNAEAFRRLGLDPQRYFAQMELYEARAQSNAAASLSRWLSYMLVQVRENTGIDPAEMQDIEIHAQNQLIQVFYDMHQVHGVPEEGVREAFRFFIHDLGIMNLGERMGIPKGRLLSQLGGVYAPIEAYFALRKIPSFQDTAKVHIRSAVSEDEEDQPRAAEEDKRGIDIVVEDAQGIVLYGQVKGLLNAPQVFAAVVPESEIGIDIFDQRLYPAETREVHKVQCARFLEGIKYEDPTQGEFVKLMKLYYLSHKERFGEYRATDGVVRALYSASKIRKSAKKDTIRQGDTRPITPFFIVAPSKWPE